MKNDYTKGLTPDNPSLESSGCFLLLCPTTRSNAHYVVRAPFPTPLSTTNISSLKAPFTLIPCMSVSL